MSDYKMVPVEPTPEMLQAACDEEQRPLSMWSRMKAVYTAMLAAAPAVQGERVGYVRRSAIELMTGDELGVRANIVKEPRYPDCVALYTAPQPAEHLPFPEGIREGAPYDDPDFEALCREHEIWGTAAAAQCAVFWEAGKRVAEQQPAEQQLDLHLFAKRMDEELEKHDIQGFEPVLLAVAEEVLGYEQQPAPDVAGLVEALTMARETIASALRANAPDYFTTDSDIARHVVIQRIDAALAAHRKQGDKT